MACRKQQERKRSKDTDLGYPEPIRHPRGQFASRYHSGIRNESKPCILSEKAFCYPNKPAQTKQKPQSVIGAVSTNESSYYREHEETDFEAGIHKPTVVPCRLNILSQKENIARRQCTTDGQESPGSRSPGCKIQDGSNSETAVGFPLLNAPRARLMSRWLGCSAMTSPGLKPAGPLGRKFACSRPACHLPNGLFSSSRVGASARRWRASAAAASRPSGAGRRSAPPRGPPPGPRRPATGRGRRRRRRRCPARCSSCWRPS